ncbi:hypothetical protein [Neptuniibacter sp.]|uniref:hypothetical protein n=1 Tax=Neptuniibacter sp. TaxID=1962643 RepID=UPI00261E8C7B|nr:hypothetical protein [Neptuniibacter sp.]MCP4598509.1 hypothetical protein [Neptuniibacter sp.]
MPLNGATFLKEADTIIPGQGIKKMIRGIGIGSLRDSDGSILTTSTEPKRASLETNFEGIQSTNGQTDLGSLQFEIPRDYDQAVDKLKVRFLAQSAGTDVPTIDAAMYRKRAGAALSSDLNPTISGAINSLTALADYVEVNCDSLSLQPGDAISMDFTLSAHATHAANIYAIEIEYHSTFVYYDKTDRS